MNAIGDQLAVDRPDPDPTTADRIAAAVVACPGVAGLHGGRFGEVATYLAGRRVTGVRITPTGVEVHITARYPITIADIDSAIRAALARLVTLPVAVTVEDLVTDPPVGTGPAASDLVGVSPPTKETRS